MKVLKKRNIALWIAAVLFCLVLISTSMNSGIYARFRSAARGLDRSRIAAFSVNAKMEGTSENTYEISFTNSSEVAVSYSLDVALNNSNPVSQVHSVKLFQGDELKKECLFPDASPYTVTFENVGSLAAGKSTGDLKLLFVMKSASDGGNADEPDFDNETTRSEEGAIVPFTVTVGFSQIN